MAKQHHQHPGKDLKLEEDAVKELMKKLRTAPPPPHTITSNSGSGTLNEVKDGSA